ncbi:hypothetical protein G6F60_014922 [Rhizopus arrhizus]|nr:hypothetical protein G6F60_014922 [Rhizopus arrhizus]
MGAIGALRVVGAAVQMVGRKHGAVGALLLPDLAPVGERDREAVSEPAHALERAEVMVEGAVLLHQDDDVFNILDGASDVVGGDGQRAADAGRERGQRGGGKACARGGL